MLHDKNKIFDSGFTRDQTHSALKKARTGYDLSNKENNLEGKKCYAWLIYTLERELGMRSTPLKEVKMLALEYYNKNPDLFKQNEVKGEELLKAIMERGYMPDKPIKTEKK